MKLITAIVCIGLLFLGFWIIRYQPKQSEILSLNEKIRQAREEYQSLEAQSKNLEKWKQARLGFTSILEQLHQTTAKTDFVPSFLRNMEKLVREERVAANDSSFRITTITPGTSGAAQKTGQPTSTAEAVKPTPGPLKLKEQNPAAAMPAPGEKNTINLSFNGRFDTLLDFLRQLGSSNKLHAVVIVKEITLSPQSTLGGGSPILSITMPFEVYSGGNG